MIMMMFTVMMMLVRRGMVCKLEGVGSGLSDHLIAPSSPYPTYGPACALLPAPALHSDLLGLCSQPQPYIRSCLSTLR